MTDFQIRATNKADYPWIEELIAGEWGSSKMITKQKIHHVDQLPAFVATQGNECVGMATHNIDNQGCELTSLNSMKEGIGIGTALLYAVKTTGSRRAVIVCG